MTTLLAVACFLTTVLFVFAVYSGMSDLAARKKASQPSATESLLRAAQIDSSVNLTNTPLAQARRDESSHQDKFRLWVEQSGLRVNPEALIVMSLAVGAVAAAAAGLLLYNWWLGLLACALTTPLPFGMVAIERHRRSDKMRSQLPDALDLMSRMLRAGQTIPQSLRGVADEFESPIADEFGYCYEQQNLGLSTEASMYEMARRTGVLELRILVVALTIHRQTGGNLSELLDNLAKVIRERYRIQGQIRALTADGRMQAAILLALPPILLVVLSLVNNDYVTILYQFPWLLIGMFGFELFGALWLHRIVSFDF